MGNDSYPVRREQPLPQVYQGNDQSGYRMKDGQPVQQAQYSLGPDGQPTHLYYVDSRTYNVTHNNPVTNNYHYAPQAAEPIQQQAIEEQPDRTVGQAIGKYILSFRYPINKFLVASTVAALFTGIPEALQELPIVGGPIADIEDFSLVGIGLRTAWAVYAIKTRRKGR